MYFFDSFYPPLRDWSQMLRWLLNFVNHQNSVRYMWYVRIKTLSSSLVEWDGLKICIFSGFFFFSWEKRNFQWRFALWRWLDWRNLVTYFSDHVNWRFKMSDWFFKDLLGMKEPDANFKVAERAIFGQVCLFFQFLKAPWRRRRRGIPFSSSSSKINLEGINLHLSESWLLES